MLPSIDCQFVLYTTYKAHLYAACFLCNHKYGHDLGGAYTTRNAILVILLAFLSLTQNNNMAEEWAKDQRAATYVIVMIRRLCIVLHRNAIFVVIKPAILEKFPSFETVSKEEFWCLWKQAH